MNFKKLLIRVLIPACLFVSCKNDPESLKNNNDNSHDTFAVAEKGSASAELNDIAVPGRSDSIQKFQQEKQKPPANGQPQPAIDWDKKIIKTASLHLEVKNFATYNTYLKEKIRQTGGYVAQEEQNQSDYKIENAVTIKVPVDQFDNAVALLTTGIEKIMEKKITSEDVTAEMVDIKARLEAKKQVRLRYLELLKQAKNMSEILNVQQEINGIQEELDAAAGRINYLSHAALFSTINLNFFQVLNPGAPENQEPSLLTRIGHSFKSGLDWAGLLLTSLISIWPLLLIIFVIYTYFKKRTRVKPKTV